MATSRIIVDVDTANEAALRSATQQFVATLKAQGHNVTSAQCGQEQIPVPPSTPETTETQPGPGVGGGGGATDPGEGDPGEGEGGGG